MLHVNTDNIIKDWLKQTIDSPIFIGEFHDDPISAELTVKLVKALYKLKYKPIGLYVEGLPIYCDSSNDNKLLKFWKHRKLLANDESVYAWAPLKYDYIVKFLSRYCSIHGIDNDKEGYTREKLWVKQIQSGNEPVKVILCGAYHVGYNEGIAAKLGYSHKSSFVITTVKLCKYDMNGKRRVLKEPKLVRLNNNSSLLKTFKIYRGNIQIGNWVLVEQY